MTNHVNVLIATPGRSMEAEYVKSLVETINYLSSNNITFRYLNQYSPQVNMAREATIMDSRYLDAFNKSPVLGQVTYDKIIWIDSDISWDVKDFMSIYNSEKDITSGVYLNEYGIPMFSVEDQEYGENIKELLSGSEEFEITANGFGFIGMKSGVFESLKRPWFENIFYTIENENKETILASFGEDYSWCKKATSSGYKIFLNPTVNLFHHKKVKIGVPVEATL